MDKKIVEAQNIFMNYAMKVTYGNPKDIIYNTNQANIWDSIIKELRQKLTNE